MSNSTLSKTSSRQVYDLTSDAEEQPSTSKRAKAFPITQPDFQAQILQLRKDLDTERESRKFFENRVTELNVELETERDLLESSREHYRESTHKNKRYYETLETHFPDKNMVNTIRANVGKQSLEDEEEMDAFYEDLESARANHKPHLMSGKQPWHRQQLREEERKEKKRRSFIPSMGI